MLRDQFLLALGAFGARPGGTRVDLIVLADRIRTGDPRQPSVQAMAIRNGRVLQLGTRADMLALRGPATRVLDMRGATIVPGLIDAHLHFTGVGLTIDQIDLTAAASFAEVVARSVAHARTNTDAWLLGRGWDQNRWTDTAFPTNDALTAAFPDRAVVLERVDGHAVIANARAMQLAGVGATTQEPNGGRILRAADGTPTGVFVDRAVELITHAIPPPPPERLARAIRLATNECARFGVTAVAEPGVGPAELAAFEHALQLGARPPRNFAMIADDPQLIATSFAHGPRSGEYGERLWVRAVKLYADGALGSRGAALLEPYDDDPKNVGLLTSEPSHLQDVATRALRSGFAACVHAIGDRGNRVVLDAFAAALATVPTHDHRLRVEHAQVLSTQDIPRFAQLGVIPSMQTSHETSDSPWAEKRVGAQRIHGAYAWRSLLDTGARIANGTDAPVEVVDTRRTFHAAFSRQDEHNAPVGGWYPAERMTRAEALASMTTWAAFANRMERTCGMLAPGMQADFVAMDRDWMTAPAAAIMSTTMLATYSGGVSVYERPLNHADRMSDERVLPRVAYCCGHRHQASSTGTSA